MSLQSLKKNLNTKANIKEAYLQEITDIAQDLSKSTEIKLIKTIDSAIENLETDDTDIIKNNTANKKIIAATSARLKRELKKHKSVMDKALSSVGEVSTDVYQELKKSDATYLGEERYAAFVDLDDDVIDDTDELHKEALERNGIQTANSSKYLRDALQAALLFNLSVNALRGRLFSASGHVNTSPAGSTLYSDSLGSLNSFGGSILNFYSNVAYVQQEGLKEVFNSNPMDERTKPICASATSAGIISIKQMESAYGNPPRMICRCDLVYINPKWKDVKQDIGQLIEEQKKAWRDLLLKQKRRKDGNFYANVSEQLKVLTKDYTPKKFTETALHTTKMQELNRGEFDSLLNNFKSTYEMRYGTR
jgi:hypothetical protein